MENALTVELIDIVSESFELGRECEDTVDGEVALNLNDMTMCGFEMVPRKTVGKICLKLLKLFHDKL